MSFTEKFKNKKLLIILLSIVGVLIIAAATVALLYALNGTNNTSDESENKTPNDETTKIVKPEAPTTEADESIKKATDAQDEGDLPSAVDAAKEAQDASGNNPDILIKAAKVYIAAGNIDDAEQTLIVARTIYAENYNDKGVSEAEALLKSIGRPYTDPKANQQPIVVTPPTPSQ